MIVCTKYKALINDFVLKNVMFLQVRMPWFSIER